VRLLDFVNVGVPWLAATASRDHVRLVVDRVFNLGSVLLKGLGREETRAFGPSEPIALVGHVLQEELGHVAADSPIGEFHMGRDSEHLNGDTSRQSVLSQKLVMLPNHWCFDFIRDGEVTDMWITKTEANHFAIETHPCAKANVVQRCLVMNSPGTHNFPRGFINCDD